MHTKKEIVPPPEGSKKDMRAPKGEINITFIAKTLDDKKYHITHK